MTWAEPKNNKEEINAAGRVLVKSNSADWENWNEAEWSEYYSILDVINNWRGSHAYPLNTFQMNLRNTSRRFEANPLIAQRIKRLFSIGHKLERFPTMKLSQMQDLGGCRAILENVSNVNQVANYYVKKSAIKHSLVSIDNYISDPKPSGYRGIHLVYRYFSDKQKSMYNGMKIEMQLRSKYQHASATAVETVGMFSGQALKSSLGSEDWQRFFSLMGSVIALREGTALAPNTPMDGRKLVAELSDYASRLKVEERLKGYSNALHAISNAPTDAYYYLLQLDPQSGVLNVNGFKLNDLRQSRRLIG
jgi:ppGpp synthetase/RelA/SpoT-type nucleotidyltranferase